IVRLPGSFRDLGRARTSPRPFRDVELQFGRGGGSTQVIMIAPLRRSTRRPRRRYNGMRDASVRRPGYCGLRSVPRRKDIPRMTPATTTRRRFLGRGAGALGLLAGLGGRPGRLLAAGPLQGAPAAPASAEPLIARGVAFLRPRQDAKGG